MNDDEINKTWFEMTKRKLTDIWLFCILNKVNWFYVIAKTAILIKSFSPLVLSKTAASF